MFDVYFSTDRILYTTTSAPSFIEAVAILSNAGNGRVTNKQNETLVSLAWGKYPACKKASPGQWETFLRHLGYHGWADGNRRGKS